MSHTIVVADDAVDLRFLVRRLLERDGRFEVLAEAGDGEQAIALATEHQPDLVLLDLSMPVLDGLQALPDILAACPGTRVVVLSGFDAEHMAQKVRDLGAVGYVEKGAAFATLVDTLLDALAGDGSPPA